jgi:phosphatidylglycerophosphate synthase
MSASAGAIDTALVLAVSPESQAVVGGVPLLVRAARTLRAAGFTNVRIVVGSRAGEVSRLLARHRVDAALWPDRPSGIDGPAADDPVLVVRGDLLFERDVLAPLLAAAEPGRLRRATSGPIESGGVPAVLCPRRDLARLVAALHDGRGTLGQVLAELGHAASPAIPLGRGLCLAPARSGASALTDALLEHLASKTAATDGYLTTLLDRHLSRAITRRLLTWPVTPNHVTLASILVGLAGALGLATVSYGARLAGVVALFVSSVLDGVDGELARARVEQSAHGARLDLTGDYLVHLATFAGLGIGLARERMPPAILWAVGALVVGVVAAMALVHALVLGGNAPRGGAGPDERSARRRAVVRVLEKLAGRDYVYLLLLFAAIGRLEWFVLAAAVGSWVFVAILLALCTPRRTRTTAGERPA